MNKPRIDEINSKTFNLSFNLLFSFFFFRQLLFSSLPLLAARWASQKKESEDKLIFLFCWLWAGGHLRKKTIKQTHSSFICLLSSFGLSLSWKKKKGFIDWLIEFMKLKKREKSWVMWGAGVKTYNQSPVNWRNGISSLKGQLFTPSINLFSLQQRKKRLILISWRMNEIKIIL